MQAALEDLVNTGRYEADDFTVVIQPFSIGMTPPLNTVRHSLYNSLTVFIIHFMDLDGHRLLYCTSLIFLKKKSFAYNNYLQENQIVVLYRI